MRARTRGFLKDENISHDSEQFDYIRELHDYLWRFTRAVIPEANGNLREWLDEAVTALEKDVMNRRKEQRG